MTSACQLRKASIGHCILATDICTYFENNQQINAGKQQLQGLTKSRRHKLKLYLIRDGNQENACDDEISTKHIPFFPELKTTS